MAGAKDRGESKLRVKAGKEKGKVRGQNGRKGRVQDTD
jgi:hypothetical protein